LTGSGAGAGRAGFLAALFLGALALRPQVVGIGPLLPSIQEDLGVSHAVAGLLATLIVLCMGIFAPPAPYLSSRLGSRFALTLSLALIGGFGIARVIPSSAAAIILLTIPVGIGSGLGNALMPVAAKEHFADRPAFATGVYATGINIGSAVAAALAVPLAGLLGGWRASLLVFSVLTLLLVGVWLVQTRDDPPHVRGREPRPRLPWRSPIAWALVACFGLLGLAYYGLNSWLPDAYIERGWNEDAAGALLGVYNVAGLVGGLVVTAIADRVGSRRFWISAWSAVMALGMVGVILLAGGAWGWMVVIGLANGALFALLMTLPLDVSDEPSQVGAVAGMMLGIGYCVAALAPLALGAVRDATGSYVTALWAVTTAIALLFLVSLFLTRERLRRGVPAALVAAGGPRGG
jgi:CP family cyanate transporter-like MFS transporter